MMSAAPQSPGPGLSAQRTISPLSGKQSQAKKIIGLGAIVSVGALMIYLTLAGDGKKPAKATDSAKPPTVAEAVPYKAAPGPEQSGIVPVAPLAKQRPPLPTELANQQVSPPAPAGAQPAAQTAADKALADAIASPVLAVGGNSDHGTAPAAAAASEQRAIGAGAEDNSPLAAHLKATKLTGSSASMLPDRDYMITIGAHIPCVLDAAMDSTVPGLTQCHVPVDVLSDNGRVVLLDKGTRIVGQYQSDLKQGQSRIFVLWTRAETPTGVIIDLGSPATDALGRAGFDGQIDNHFWERFGGAILLSVIDDGLATVAAAQQKQGTTVTETNTQGAAQSSASTALQNTINIPPTLRKNQGEEVAVIAARDLDFHGVYNLREVPTR
jgi:type IV secretion system protein VirB10